MKFHQHDPFGLPSGVKLLKSVETSAHFYLSMRGKHFFAPAGTRRVFGVPGGEGNNHFFEFRNSKSIKSVWFLCGFPAFQGHYFQLILGPPPYTVNCILYTCFFVSVTVYCRFVSAVTLTRLLCALLGRAAADC